MSPALKGLILKHLVVIIYLPFLQKTLYSVMGGSLLSEHLWFYSGACLSQKYSMDVKLENCQMIFTVLMAK
jgi:hypothetical protein